MSLETKDKSTGSATDSVLLSVAQLAKFYPPNPYKHGRLTGLYTNAEGQTVKRCTTLEGQGATAELLNRHLLAQPGFLALGYLPGNDTGTTAGMLDLDVKDYPQPGSLDDALHRLFDVCHAHGVHCYPETSTRGGRHVHIFSETLISHSTMSAALRVLADEAALVKTEPYPAGDGPLSTWYFMPYPGAAHDGLGRTQLTTDTGQIIPVTELDEWLELTPVGTLTALAEAYTPAEETVTDTPADDLKPEAVTAICRAIQNPPKRTFDRHGSLVAFMNLGRRCGRLSEVVRTLRSEEVRARWAPDGSRDADEWSKEIDRWTKAAGTHRRGIKFLLAQGFTLGHMPSVKDDPGPKSKEAPDLLSFSKTDYGNAERLHALYGHKFRYCPALGYLVWDETRWKPDEGSELTRMALATARALFAQAGNEANSERRESWVKHSLTCERKAAIENAVSLAKSIPGVYINVNELDADPMLLNVENGTIDLRTGEIRPHDPHDLITKLAPVAFDPAAESPLWDEFQDTVCGGDADLVAFKQRAYGYTATGKTSEDALFIPFGNGANGKSTEQNIILRILGTYANTAQFETFAVKKNESVRNDIADLVGSRFVSASEGESRQRLAEGLVKQMTGGDPMKARFLHKEYFTFQPAFKLWLATNHKPVIRGTDHGIWRRIRLVPYAVTIPPEKRDRRLREKLEGELSGILNWMLKGCADWLEHGLGEAEAVSAATESYRQESDVLSSFLSEKCTTDELHRVLAKTLYQAYKKFCEDNGDDSFSSTMFGRLLNERGYMAEKRGGTVYRLGLSLQEENGGQDS